MEIHVDDQETWKDNQLTYVKYYSQKALLLGTSKLQGEVFSNLQLKSVEFELTIEKFTGVIVEMMIGAVFNPDSNQNKDMIYIGEKKL